MRAAKALVFLCFGLSFIVSGCEPRPTSRSGGDAWRSLPPERTNADEWDGPTAPREGANRPPNQGAGYDSPQKAPK